MIRGLHRTNRRPIRMHRVNKAISVKAIKSQIVRNLVKMNFIGLNSVERFVETVALVSGVAPEYSGIGSRSTKRISACNAQTLSRQKGVAKLLEGE